MATVIHSKNDRQFHFTPEEIDLLKRTIYFVMGDKMALNTVNNNPCLNQKELITLVTIEKALSNEKA